VRRLPAPFEPTQSHRFGIRKFVRDGSAVRAKWRGQAGSYGSGGVAGGTAGCKKRQLFRYTIGGVEITAEVDNPPPTKDDDELFEKWVRTDQRHENACQELERRGIRRVEP
jgi:hypothetical protein